MFDIGFAELVLIFIVGLLVLGPERLPAVVREVSLWLGRLRRSFNAIRDEIEREVGADEIKRQLHNESILKNFKDAGDEVGDSLKATREQLKSLEFDVSDIVKPTDSPPSNGRPAGESDQPGSDKQP